MNGEAQTDTRPPRPKPLVVIPENIPDKLRKSNQWVNWRYEWRSDKWTKPPIQPNGRAASSTDPETWSDFQTCLKTYKQGRADGVGFVLDGEDDFIGVDLDHCVDGKPAEWAQAIIDKFQSYTELSPSGSGLRIIVKGSLTDDGRKRGNVEMYAAKRYFTLTGRRLEQFPATIEVRQEPIEWLFDKYFPKEKPRAEQRQGNYDPSDEEVFKRASAAKNGDKFKRLWGGDTTGYPSHSEADAALCMRLSFFASDEAQVD